MYTFMKCLSWIICHLPGGCCRSLGNFFGFFFLDLRPQETESVGSAANLGLRHYG